MPELSVIEGSRGGLFIRVRVDALEELQAEIIEARRERLVLADNLRKRVRSAASLVATQHPAAAGTYLLEALRLIEQDAMRAIAMSAACPCGSSGLNHGHADEDALAVPARRAA